jgi:hypothetical protein
MQVACFKEAPEQLPTGTTNVQSPPPTSAGSLISRPRERIARNSIPAPSTAPACSEHAGTLPTHKNVGQHPRVLTGEEHAGSAAGVPNTRQRQDRSPNRLLYNHAAPTQSSASRMHLRSGRHAASDISGAVLQVHGPLPALAGPSGRCRNLIVLHVPFAVHDNA